MRSFFAMAICATLVFFSNTTVRAQDLVVKVEGMTCAVCVAAITESVLTNENVEEVEIDLESGLVTVMPKKDMIVDAQAVKDLIKDVGYKIAPSETATEDSAE